jgi:hypothetical protein
VAVIGGTETVATGQGSIAAMRIDKSTRGRLWLISVALALVAACGGDDDNGTGGTPDATVPVGLPFDAVDRQWSFVPVAGTECMDGSATGMGVNLVEGSANLLIYMEGGGACFNPFTCNGVAHPNGYGDRDLQVTVNQSGSKGVFNRDDPDNPFADWNIVFIPYCTGDIFAGNNPNGSGGRNQVGYRNMGAYTATLVDAFADRLNHVVLSGSSAGGFGALYNFDRVQQALGDVPVTLLDDSGPPMSSTYMTPCLQEQVRTTWGMDETLPADCTECETDNGGLGNLPVYLATKYPDRNLGIISSTTDGVIRLFYGFGYPSCANPSVPMPEVPFAEGVAELRDVTLAPFDNAHVYTINGGLHVWLLENPLGVTTSGGVGMTDWIRGLLGEGSFSDVVP